ncbi:hypothetical protein CSC70_02520 [Pseudoxanthomonas kalamensis DSM 18571]|uniref:M48 family metallopeptidase n=1 Tax=Pseudoxanthomonas kalamensis TaxID=289483 RepID=UPI00139178F1|nr:SprT family zinc-dependent metalloprotease [Pseudoxanthomonas kalamensis]KAF1712413.1 hypothetical protein CSC70_02520 [Pseudoxanthomonas kalamensis DSM 18571]
MSLRRLISPPRPVARPIERDHVELMLDDGSTVTVLRVRDPRARRLKLSVDERGARLTLPARASRVSGARFLLQHREWLQAQLAHFRDADVLPDFVAGQTDALPLRGQSWPLHWQDGPFSNLRREGDRLLFQRSARAGDAALRRVLRQFYEAEARADVGVWMPKYLSDLPRAPRRIRFKVMSSQWGSLAPDDSLTLDLSLVLARPSAFEYVLVHELCHLIHRDHSPRFWAEVEARRPDWRQERDYFHHEGRALKGGLRHLLAI